MENRTTTVVLRRILITVLLLVTGSALGITPGVTTPPAIPKPGPKARPKRPAQIGEPVNLTRVAIPEDNPQTLDKVALGEKLFFDGHLSADGTVACASCHDPERAFTDGRPSSVGIRGRVGQRNAPTILNALYSKTQFWDGRVRTLEEQAELPIVSPIEMGQPTLDAAIARIAPSMNIKKHSRLSLVTLPTAQIFSVRSRHTSGHSFRLTLPLIISSRARTVRSMTLRSAAG